MCPLGLAITSQKRLSSDVEAAITALASVAVAAISTWGAVKANRAEKNSRPVSNGFAAGVREDLAEIRRLVTDHLRDHSIK